MPGRADERPSLRSAILGKLQSSISGADGADVSGVRAQRTSGRSQSFDPAIFNIYIQSTQTTQFDAFNPLPGSKCVKSLDIFEPEVRRSTYLDPLLLWEQGQDLMRAIHEYLQHQQNALRNCCSLETWRYLS